MLIEGKNLLPLHFLNVSWEGYFIDAQHMLWSSKRGGKLLRLYGYRHRSGNRRFTLNGVTYFESYIKKLVLTSANFKQETSGVIKEKTLELHNRSWAATLNDGLRQKGYLIGTVQNESLSFSKNPAIHLTMESMKSEMERLATTHPGKKFVAVKVVNSVQAGITWD